MIELNWAEFDQCVLSIYKQCKYKSFEGVYGFPRGGICMAVALSHSLDLPLLYEPKENSLIVDDIYDSGHTLEKIKYLKNIETHVWVSKIKPTWWNSYRYIKEKEWIIFPWEKGNNSNTDRYIYYESRT